MKLIKAITIQLSRGKRAVAALVNNCRTVAAIQVLPRKPVERYLLFVAWAILICSTIASVGWFLTYGANSVAEAIMMAFYIIFSFGIWSLLFSVFIVVPLCLLGRVVRSVVSRYGA